jgi:hypothetical protein
MILRNELLGIASTIMETRCAAEDRTSLYLSMNFAWHSQSAIYFVLHRVLFGFHRALHKDDTVQPPLKQKLRDIPNVILLRSCARIMKTKFAPSKFSGDKKVRTVGTLSNGSQGSHGFQIQVRNQVERSMQSQSQCKIGAMHTSQAVCKQLKIRYCSLGNILLESNDIKIANHNLNNVVVSNGLLENLKFMIQIYEQIRAGEDRALGPAQAFDLIYSNNQNQSRIGQLSST